jgi:uncharacterized protein (DUF302 family)
MSVDGLVTIESSRDFGETLHRLETALAAKGITVFARVDHAAGAVAAGMALRPTTLLMFGNPKAGTPLMQAVQTAGIDLPLKYLVWRDESSKTQVSYNDPAWIAARHGIGPGADGVIEAMRRLLAALAKDAAGA